MIAILIDSGTSRQAFLGYKKYQENQKYKGSASKKRAATRRFANLLNAAKEVNG
ncbi:MAG: hypothetical protein ABIK98_00215 [Pseudomonadota bacterium]|uniref:Uncharacterized protein n=1 Tax=Candidatus Desulfatibia profunda TaxID=2841695 RepID=A0A8J6TN12_9BACT|nr:hypothetical protein [Candidatus Desulfatibia profunda]